MKTVVIANPRAANGKVGRHWPDYRHALRDACGEVEERMTGSPGEATLLTRQALQEGCERVVAVGGDGTVNEVVNGFFDESGDMFSPDAELLYISAGTGGDFARSIGMRGAKLSEDLARVQPRPIDVGRATYLAHDGRKVTRFFVNVLSFGSSGVIVDRVNHSTKVLGGKVTFLLGTIRGMMAYTNQRIRLTVDDHYDDELVVNTVAIGNGRFFGGSMMVTPHALLDDGMMDVVVLGNIGVGDFVRHSGKLYKGEHLRLRDVFELRGAKVRALPLGGDVLIDLDGEQPGRLPLEVETLPRALKVAALWERAVAVER